MKRLNVLVFALAAMASPISMSAYDSPTEGVLTSDFVDEATMKQDLLQMLADFSLWMKQDFQDCQYPNSIDEVCGCFKGENTMGNNEQGVRPNADLSMICAFLVKYAKPAGVTLPSGVTWNDIETMAMKSLVFAYSTHKANKLKVCSGGNYWGSTGTSDSVWESSLWAMSVAYSAFFQWDKLSDAQKGYIYEMLKAECNYELNRSIPTGFAGDTKAEENGWEADILAATLGLFPDDALATQWFDRLRQFAVNSYSHISDLQKQSPIDAWYDGRSAADLYLGSNIYNDYTLQNHNMFHTSYLNVVMQELGEAALALKMFQLGTKGTEHWKSNALMHNNQAVMDEVLNWLATADGELAMPNGNDWSLFLFDQITSYSTQACFQRDADALLLENLAYKNIKARQKTTSDGSWLLRPDVGARRMGVEAHRVMMTYLMHEVMPTANMTAPTWDEFRARHTKTKYFPEQNIVRGMSKDRFTCFSWNSSLPDYSGVIVPNSVDKAKIMVPFRTHHTGNLLGVYSRADYTASMTGRYAMFPDAWAMNGQVTFNSIPQAFCIYSTSGNAVIMVDALKANSATTVSSEQGGMMGISVDEFTNTQRTIYYQGGSVTTDGSSYSTWISPWSNIDNYLGFVVTKHGETVTGAFGDKSNNNSINTAKIYPSYNGSSSSVGTSMNHIRGFVYYTGVTAVETQALSQAVVDLTTLPSWPEGWHGILVPDPDGTYYMLLANLYADNSTPWTDLTVNCPMGAPVFSQVGTITSAGNTSTFYCAKDYNIANELKVFVSGVTNLQAVQGDENPRSAYLQNTTSGNQDVTVFIIDENGTTQSCGVSVPANSCMFVSLNCGSIQTSTASFPGNYRNVAYGSSVDAGSYDGTHLPFSVIDCDDNEFYQTMNSASSGAEYLLFNLRNQYTVNKIVITPQAGQPAPSTYFVQAGESADNLSDLAVTTTTEAGNTVLTFDNVNARFVRLKLLGSSRVAINKVAIYGAIASDSGSGQQENLSTQYFSNPSFENDDITTLNAVNSTADGLRGYNIAPPTGWTLSGTDVTKLLVTADCYTDNNFGKVTTLADGSQAYYLRMGWNTGSTTIATSSTQALPAGTYKISIDYRTGYANSASSTFVFSCAGMSNQAVTFNQGGLSDWRTASITFTLASDQIITPQVTVTWKSGGSCIMVDNLRLEAAEQGTDYVALHKQQITANGGDATFLLKDPKCESAANTSWTGSTAAINNREHWSGEGYQNTYQERTSSGTISQTLSNMPAGTYKAVAALRANTGCTITPKLNNTAGTTFTGTGNSSTTISQINKNGVQMPYHADRGFTTRNTGRGWQWGSATATVSDGNLTIEFQMQGSSWMSIDDVHLYYISDGTETYCESINADASTFEASTTGKTVTADIIVANNNTLLLSPSQVFTDNAPADNNLVGGTEMESLVLYDKQPLRITSPAFTAAQASYLRPVTSQWGTLILPYSVESSTAVQFYKLHNASDEYLVFSETDVAPANTPATFKRLQSDINVDFTAQNVTVCPTTAAQGSSLTTATGWTAMGAYEKTTDLSGNDIFYIAQDKFWHYDEGQPLSLNPFRTILRGPTDADVKSLAIQIGEETTGIEREQWSEKREAKVYDLTGRKHSASSVLPKRMYIIDGKTVFVK